MILLCRVNRKAAGIAAVELCGSGSCGIAEHCSSSRESRSQSLFHMKWGAAGHTYSVEYDSSRCPNETVVDVVLS